MTDAPAELSRAEQALAKASTPAEVKAIYDIAEAYRVYAKSADEQRKAAVLKLDAADKGGAMLTTTPKRRNRFSSSDRLSQLLGIESEDAARQLASRWQQVNEHHDRLDEYKTDNDEPSLGGFLVWVRTVERDNRRNDQRKRNRALVEGVESPEGMASTVVLDPPWDWGDEGDIDQFGRGRPVYETRSVDEIAKHFDDEIAPHIEDAAHCYLWITNRSLPKGFGLLRRWEFRYVTCLTWVKPSFGMGNYFRGQTEHVLFGVRGSLPLLRNDVGTVITAPRGDQHSVKPDEFYDLVETCSPGPWMDVYARRERTGWLSWGAIE